MNLFHTFAAHCILRAEVYSRTNPKTNMYNQAYENFIKWCATNDIFDIFLICRPGPESFSYLHSNG
jgi:hypothetical protein